MYKLLQPKENMFVDASVPLQHAESTDAQRRCQKMEKKQTRNHFCTEIRSKTAYTNKNSTLSSSPLSATVGMR